jgi:hypothetical protein
VNRLIRVAPARVLRLHPPTGRWVSYAAAVLPCLLALMPATIAATRGVNPETKTTARTTSTLPRFSSIREWEDLVKSKATAQYQRNEAIPPFPYGAYRPAATVAGLCWFFHLPFSPGSVWIADRSPLAWPAVFHAPATNPRRQRIEIASLLSTNRLAYRELTALEPAQIADSITTAIAAGTPVLLNAPGAPVVFGYDRREPDPWWWVSVGAQTQLILESERLARFVYWDDDPAASVLWVVSGVDSTKQSVPGDRANDYEFLRRIAISARGDPDNGVTPYPLSIRDFRDYLEASEIVALPSTAADATDPLGIRRATAAREHLLSALERLAQAETDTNVSAPLRLAQYYGHSALEVLHQLADSLYGDPTSGGTNTPRADWTDVKPRQAAARRLIDLLRSEKQAVEQIDRALTARALNEAPPPKDVAPKKPPRHRRR